ncbi:MAG: molybdopterin molybdotransferase [Chloroflexota bacterium]|nr:molybdopterin molybdotransferase [Chloroflexota bacterium]
MAEFIDISYDEALATILRAAIPLEAQTVPLAAALGDALAEDIDATLDMPGFDNSAMDGYAVRAADAAHASARQPVELRVVGRVAAGAAEVLRVGPGEAAGIATGAPMPAGADAVVRIEVVEERGTRIVLMASVGVGKDVRHAGEDVRRGARLLARGQEVRPAEIAVLAALGRQDVQVTRRPSIAILTTGDELVQPGTALRSGQLYNANLPALTAQATEAGAIARPMVSARDDPGEIRSRVEDGLRANVLVVSAGVSMGERDYVRSALAAFGEVASWRLRMRPVRPLAFGRVGQTLVVGLPGNTVASQLAFELLVRPAIRAMAGHTRIGRTELVATLGESLENRDRVLTFVRGILEGGAEGPVVRSAGGQGTANVATLARADCLIVVPEGIEWLDPGALVRVRLLSGNG